MTTALAVPEIKALTGQITMLAEYFNYELEPHVLRIYVDALRDVPIDHLRAGCRRSILTCRYMPKVAEIRAATDDELRERERVTGPDAPPHRLGRHCTACEDTGWQTQPDYDARSGRAPWARRCPCYQTNPVLLRLCAPRRYSDADEKRR